jgi:serine/threonine protein kinase
MKDISYTIRSRANHILNCLVYRAREAATNEDVQIILLAKEQVAPVVWQQYRENLANRPYSDPPYLQVCAAFEYAGHHGIISEDTERIELSSFIELAGALPPDMIRRFCMEIGGALDRLYKQGRRFGRIDASNISITKDGTFLLYDPDLTRLLTTSGKIAENEIILQETQPGSPTDNVRFELYCFGLILYLITTGMPAQVQPDDWFLRRDQLSEILDPTNVSPDYLPRLRRLVLRCIHGDQEIQYQSFGELFQEADSLPAKGETVFDLKGQWEQLSFLSNQAVHQADSLDRMTISLDSMSEEELFLPEDLIMAASTSTPTVTIDPEPPPFESESQKDALAMIEEIRSTLQGDEPVKPALDALSSSETESASESITIGSPLEEHVAEPARQTPAVQLNSAPDWKQSISSFFSEMFQIPGIRAIMFIEPAGTLRDPVGDPRYLEAPEIGNLILFESEQIRRMAQDLKLQPCRVAIFEYQGASLICRPISNCQMVVVTSNSSRLGTILHRIDHWSPALALSLEQSEP